MLSGIFTALLIVVFIGICLWAYSSKRKPDFDEAARLPLDDNEPDEENRHE
jgi:cytochrome c oxidase cbb3-type subunit 4